MVKMKNKYWDGLIKWLGFGTPKDQWERKVSHVDTHAEDLYNDEQANTINIYIDEVIIEMEEGKNEKAKA